MKLKLIQPAALVMLMLFISLSTLAQIPNDSPYPIDFLITDSNGSETFFEYSSMADFGVPLGITVSGDLEWARDDGIGNPDSPEPYWDSLNCNVGTTQNLDGKIALIRRGMCFFSQKIYAAQEAGAIGAIICNNNLGNELVNMGAGDFAELVTIPAIFITYEDCEFVRQAIDNGESTLATFRVNTFYNNTAPYAYGTPVEHILPLEEIQVNILNVDTVNQVLNTTVSVDITDPNGVVTTLTEIIDVIEPVEDRVVQFETYLPEIMGEYNMVFSNSIATETLETTFEITDCVWQMDNNNVVDWIAQTPGGFVEDGLRYDIGSTYLTGEIEDEVFMMSFMLENPTELYTGDEDSDLFQIRLYDMDPDGDGVGPDGSEADYSSFQVVGFADYSLNGNEQPYEPIFVEFDTPVQLKANGQYLIMVKYSGISSGLGIPPHYAFGGTENYPYFGTPVFTDRLYMDGWTGNYRAVVRLYNSLFGEKCIIAVKDEPLESNKINVFPNPTSEMVNLELNLDSNANEVEVKIMDVMGRLVSMEILNNVHHETAKFDVSSLSNGTYFMAVTTPEGARSVKFVVLR